MRGPFSILFITIFALCTDQTRAATDKKVCYYESWNSDAQRIENISPFTCTHLIYAFVGINTDGSVNILNPDTDITNNGFKRFTSLKNKNPSLKTMVAIGGWSEPSSKFSQVASSAGLRATFVTNMVQFLKQYNFDGVDVDWEYPTLYGGASSDVGNYIILLSQLKASCAQNNLLVTAAVAASKWTADQAYKISEMNKYLDFINLMAYDFYGSWSTQTAPNAGLADIKYCVDYWISQGANPAKLILGLPFYGQNANLLTSQNGFGAPATWTAALDYSQILQMLKSGGWTEVMDPTQQVPYAYKGSQWMTYDNTQSITTKVKYAISKGLGGVMVWSIDKDDILGVSGVKMQLMQIINSLIISSNSGSVTPVASSTTTTTTTTPASSSGDMSYLCKNVGYVRDPTKCNVFYSCTDNNNKYTAYMFTCPAGLVFDTTVNVCNWPYNVKC